MSGNLRVVTFRVSADAFPAGWHELKRRLGTRAARRSTDSHPIWRRIDGRGFTIWLSEIRLADSISEPPIWEVRMEALATLSPEGQQCWEEAYAALCDFFADAELPFEAI